jgi:hypothetical protein
LPLLKFLIARILMFHSILIFSSRIDKHTSLQAILLNHLLQHQFKIEWTLDCQYSLILFAVSEQQDLINQVSLI